MSKKHYPLIRTIYLYLFALVGLTLLIIGSVRFLDMGLKAFVFTKAEQDRRYYDVPPVACVADRVEKYQNDETFTVEERELMKQWLAEYEGQEKVNYVTVDRHRNASINLSLILVGLPLYLFHWQLIKKELKKKEKEEDK